MVTLLAFGAHTNGWWRHGGKLERYDGGVSTGGNAVAFSHAHTVASTVKATLEEMLKGPVL
jgi:hypothetical protein